MTDRLSKDLIGDLSPNAYGWRLHPDKPKIGEYSHNDLQWDWYLGHLTVLATMNSVALQTDIVSCFASISVDILNDSISDRCPSNDVSRRLCDLLDAFSSVNRRPGLPQRSFASAVLANMYLRPIDDLLQHYAGPAPRRLDRQSRNSTCARWMDDIWLFCSSPGTARRCQAELQSLCRDLRLNLNSAKTQVLEGPAVANSIRDIEHSAIDDAIASEDLGPLDELIDKLLDSPEYAGRTSVRFACTRMRTSDDLDRAEDLLDAAERMPHVADVLTRLFKNAFAWRSMQDWFLDYANSDWASYEWSVAQFARIFSSAGSLRREIKEFFATAIRDSNTSLPLLAVASQRMVRWDAPKARTAFSDCFDRLSSPQARRIVALCALSAREGRSKVRKWLAADRENVPTLTMLEGLLKVIY